MDDFDWIMSEGGPLLLVEEALAHSWRGVFGLSVPATGMANDYDRACRDDAVICPVVVDGGTAFSLNSGGPLDSAFWQSPQGSTHLVQLVFGDHDVNYRDMLEGLSPTLFDDPDVVTHFACATGALVMFDSACAWTDLDKLARTVVIPGSYEVRTKSYETDRFLAVLHRFHRL